MREGDFIRQNSAKWEEFEELFDRDRKEPRRISELYVQITEDLSYARTFYPNRSVRAYLNSLSQRVLQRMHRGQGPGADSIRRFWTLVLPAELYAARVDLLISLLLFLGAVAIGLFSSVHDPDFAQLILGPDYVEMTEQNIAAGDPMKVYKDSRPFPMFLRIFSNNLFVDVLTFTLGIFFAIGTAFVTLYNGIMVGAFQHFFVGHGLLAESALTIWQHGTLEMSALVLSGAAGLTMGRGVAFPGTYTRLQAFRLSALRGFRMMMPVFVFTFLAALLESWVTRATEMPLPIRLFVILASLLIVLFYLVWYPRKLAQAGLLEAVAPPSLPARETESVRLDEPRTVGEMFAQSFTLYGQIVPVLLRRIALFALGMALLLAYAPSWLDTYALYLDVYATAGGVLDFFNNLSFYLRYTLQFTDYQSLAWLAIPNLLAQSMIFVAVFRGMAIWPGNGLSSGSGESRVEVKNGARNHKKRYAIGLLRLGPPLVTSQLLLFLPGGWRFFTLGCLFPLICLWAACSWYEELSIPRGLQRAVHLLQLDKWRAFGVYLSTLLLTAIGIFMINSPLLGLYTEIIQFNLPGGHFAQVILPILLIVFLAYFIVMSLVPVIVGALTAYYFHARELDEAQGLLRKLQTFGQNRRR